MLSISHLSKSFGTLEVLRDINLYVNRRELVSIIGPSGCGKSTLFDIIAGIENQTGGIVEIENKVISKRAGMFGYMLQSPLLLPWRNIEQNIILGLDIKGESRKKSLIKARKLLEEFGLINFAKKYPNSLSGGMKQRVAMLRTILFNKDFLLLDEPFGALDALTRLECQKWLVGVWGQFHCSILFVTHDIREAVFLSDRIYVMSKRPGKIVEEIKDVKHKKPIDLEKKLLRLLLN